MKTIVQSLFSCKNHHHTILLFQHTLISAPVQTGVPGRCTGRCGCCSTDSCQQSTSWCVCLWGEYHGKPPSSLGEGVTWSERQKATNTPRLTHVWLTKQPCMNTPGSTFFPQWNQKRIPLPEFLSLLTSAGRATPPYRPACFDQTGHIAMHA